MNNKKYLISLFAILTLATGVAHAKLNIPVTSVSKIVIFGDSLSDAGYQDNSGMTGKKPIWTSPNSFAPNNDANTWAGYLALDMSMTVPQPNNGESPAGQSNVTGTLTSGTNYAAGGATVNSSGFESVPGTYLPSPVLSYTEGSTTYKGQVNWYLEQNNGHADPNAIYFIWIGANDLFKVQSAETAKFIAAKQYDQVGLTKAIAATSDTVTSKIVDAVDLLKNAGAKHVVVLTLPYLGYVPETALDYEVLNFEGVKGMPATPQAFAYSANQGVALFNSLLVNKLQVEPIATVVPINAPFVKLVSTKPGSTYTDSKDNVYTIANTTDSACKVQLSNIPKAFSCTPSEQDGGHYIFEDLVHPTAQTHKILADYIYTYLFG